MKGSWKTSAFGIAGIVSLIVGAIYLMADGDPTTNPNWTLIVPVICTAIANLFARDNKVTSEEVGAGAAARAAPPSPKSPPIL